MAEEIIFRVGVDTSGATSEINKVTGSVDGLSDAVQDEFSRLRLAIKSSEKELSSINDKFGETSIEAAEASDKLRSLKDQLKSFDSKFIDLGESPIEQQLKDIQDRVASGTLTQRQLTKAVKEYQTIALQAGETSPIGQQAITEAGALSDRIQDLSQRVKVAGEDGANMQAALQLGSTITAGYGALQGVTALVGQESEDLTQTLVKLQGVQAALAGIEQIRAALEKESALRIKATTLAQQLYTLAVGETTGALKLLRLALVATGIGALIVGIVLLVQNWDKLTGAIGRNVIAQEGLNDTLDDYKKGATEAVTKTSQVKVAFDLAKQGVISKEEALKTYNDTLGDSFGKATDLNEAERLYAEKTNAYIKATALRAQANALLSKAAEEQANALTAGMEDQTTVADKASAAMASYIGGQDALMENLTKQQKLRVKEAEANHKARNNIFTQEAERLMKEAEVTENANGIKSDSEQKLLAEQKKNADELAKKRKEAADKAHEEELKRAEELKRLEREITDATIAAIADRETRERMALAEKHRRELEDLRIQYGERQELIMALEEKQAIEQRNFERTQDEISQQAVEEAKAKHEADQQAQIKSTESLGQTLFDILKKSAEDQKAIDDAVYASKAALASNVASVIGQLAGLAKDGSNTQKALALTEIAINTAVGFVNGLRIAQQSAAATGPAAAFVFPVFYAQQIGAVLAAAKQAKNILGSGASVSAPAVPSAGGSGFSGGVQQQGSLTDNGSTSTQTVNNSPPVQVVLVTDSLKKVQKQSSIAESVATFG